jgi:hypothetical protein
MGSFAIAAVWSFPAINLLAQLAATCLGGALLVEGLGRVHREVQSRQPRRRAVLLELEPDLPRDAGNLGDLQGVFQTGNRWDDSLAIVLFGGMFAFGGLYVLDWLEAGFISAKLIAALVMAPLMVGYLGYRALRNLYDRRRILLFTGGFLYQKGRQVQVHPWDRVKEVKQVEINDAIDEWAVEIHVCNGTPPLRFTCAHFRNLHYFAGRLQQLVDGPRVG